MACRNHYRNSLVFAGAIRIHSVVIGFMKPGLPRTQSINIIIIIIH
jgi:hypothetical protein